MVTTKTKDPRADAGSNGKKTSWIEKLTARAKEAELVPLKATTGGYWLMDAETSEKVGQADDPRTALAWVEGWLAASSG